MSIRSIVAWFVWIVSMLYSILGSQFSNKYLLTYILTPTLTGRIAFSVQRSDRCAGRFRASPSWVPYSVSEAPTTYWKLQHHLYTGPLVVRSNNQRRTGPDPSSKNERVQFQTWSKNVVKRRWHLRCRDDLTTEPKSAASSTPCVGAGKEGCMSCCSCCILLSTDQLLVGYDC